jgi:D-alanine-D-alanine ligase
MSGYGRIDLRLNDSGQFSILEANPNPGIARDEESSLSAIKGGFSYESFIQHILNLGLKARSQD